MTLGEAEMILRTENPGDSGSMERAKQLGAMALARLQPQAPKMRAMKGFAPEVASELCCPLCRCPVTNYWVRRAKPAHCQFCGQAIDWRETEETSGPVARLEKERRWGQNLEHLCAGAFGDPAHPETLLKYWLAQEAAGYPGALECANYFKDMLEKEGKL